MTTLDGLRLTTVADYHKMAEAGVFAPEERIELIEGYIRTMSPIGRKHFIIVTNLDELFAPLVRGIYRVSVQNPVVLSETSQPQPDITIIKRFSEVRLPTAADVLMVIEVSETTLTYDRTVKVPLYGSAGIPEVWIIDVKRNTVEQFHTPQDSVYTHQHLYQKGEVISTLIGIDVDTTDVLI